MTHLATLATRRANSHQFVLVYPYAKAVQFAAEHLTEFIEHYLLPEDTLAETYNPFTGGNALKQLTHVKRPVLFQERDLDKDLVLICGHTKRDVLCGVLSSLLTEVFQRVLVHEAMSDKIEVGLISHVDGHAYAGNMTHSPRTNYFPVV